MTHLRNLCNDDSLIGGHATCGGIFRNHLGTFLGAFSCNMGNSFVFLSEIYGFIFVMEFAAHHGWRNVWLESDRLSPSCALKQMA